MPDEVEGVRHAVHGAYCGGVLAHLLSATPTPTPSPTPPSGATDFWDGANVTLLIAFAGTVLVPLLNEAWKRLLEHGAFKRQMRREGVERIRSAARVLLRTAPGERKHDAEKFEDAKEDLHYAVLTLDLGVGARRNYRIQSHLMEVRRIARGATPSDSDRPWSTYYATLFLLDRVIAFPRSAERVGQHMVAHAQALVDGYANSRETAEQPFAAESKKDESSGA